MSKHAELIERLRKQCANTNGRSIEQVLDDFIGNMDEAADALEAQAREIEGMQAQLAATAKSAFEAMPHDIPRRMKRKICVETGWSMSMVSRAYIELRAAFTGEKYTANEDLDAAMSEIEGLRKDAERWKLATEQAEFYSMVVDGTGLLCSTLPEAEAAIDAAKGDGHVA
jgi:phage-related tail protein